MEHLFSRTELLIGEDNLDKLKRCKVIVVGIGGVGSYVVESLIRSGIQNITMVDSDKISLTNLNRQIHANMNTIDKFKVDVMKEKILAINNKCNVVTHKIFINKDNLNETIGEDADYVVDAIDTVTSKIALIEYCKDKNIKIISCMGTGNKLDPNIFKIVDINKTKVCPLAKVMRYELRKRGIEDVKVLYSEEMPLKPKIKDIEGGIRKKQVPGSIAFVPSVAGMLIGAEVVKDIID